MVSSLEPVLEQGLHYRSNANRWSEQPLLILRLDSCLHNNNDITQAYQPPRDCLKYCYITDLIARTC